MSGKRRLPPFRWFVLCVESGMDAEVRREIGREKKKKGLEKLVKRVMVPRCLQPVWKDDKEVMQNRMMFPGYIMVRCRFTSEVFHLLNSIRGSKGCLMNPRNPTPVKDVEEAKIMIRQKLGKEKEEIDLPEEPKPIPFKLEDRVKIVDGAWVGFSGTVVDISTSRKVQVRLTVMGKKTDIWFNPDQLEKT